VPTRHASNLPSDPAKKTSSNYLNRQLGLYSLAAAAAGVSLLALAQPAAGEIVVTHKTIPIPLAPLGSKEPVTLSMANNGVNNLIFNLYDANSSFRMFLVAGAGREHGVVQDGVITGGTWDPYALALARGVEIGPGQKDFFWYNDLVELSATVAEEGTVFRYSKGYWGKNPQNRYLGVVFTLDGETHYGWIRLTVTTNTQLHGPYLSATITEYAYETEANKAIEAGQTSESKAELQAPEKIQNPQGPSLGMLAAGAEGLSIWRREEALAAN
jgi:hypothetical protein